MKCNPPGAKNYKEEAKLRKSIDNATDPYSWYGRYKSWEAAWNANPDLIGAIFAADEVCEALEDGASKGPGGRVLSAHYPRFEKFVLEAKDAKAFKPPRSAEEFFDRLKPGDVVILNDDKIFLIPAMALLVGVQYNFKIKSGSLPPKVAEAVRKKIEAVTELLGERAINIEAALQVRGPGFGNELGTKPGLPGVIVFGGA